VYSNSKSNNIIDCDCEACKVDHYCSSRASHFVFLLRVKLYTDFVVGRECRRHMKHIEFAAGWRSYLHDHVLHVALVECGVDYY
jgi:hypothetical protein